MLVYYFAYPYTRDPKGTTKEVQRRVLAILRERHDIVPIIPHFVFSALYGHPKGYTLHCLRDWEFEIIGRCDGFVYDPTIHSVGVLWEMTIAKAFGVPCYTYRQVMECEDVDKSNS